MAAPDFPDLLPTLPRIGQGYIAVVVVDVGSYGLGRLEHQQREAICLAAKVAEDPAVQHVSWATSRVLDISRTGIIRVPEGIAVGAPRIGERYVVTEADVEWELECQEDHYGRPRR